MAKKWIQKAKAKMKSSGTIGSFSKAAKKVGESALSFANKVLTPKSKASSSMKKKAVFAKNVSKSKKK